MRFSRDAARCREHTRVLAKAQLERIENNRQAALRIRVRGCDLLDGTPVLDVKPYVPYADAFPDARAGWIDELDGQPDGPDDLEYWPPPAHLSKPDT